jgi:hypothetical protein
MPGGYRAIAPVKWASFGTVPLLNGLRRICGVKAHTWIDAAFIRRLTAFCEDGLIVKRRSKSEVAIFLLLCPDFNQ